MQAPVRAGPGARTAALPGSPDSQSGTKHWLASPRWNPHPDVRIGRHVVYGLHVHLTFFTRYRRNAFADANADPNRTEESVREVCTDFEAELKSFNSEQGHSTCSCTTRPRVSSPSRPASSRTLAPDGSVRGCRGRRGRRGRCRSASRRRSAGRGRGR
ncbi:transposase [Streptomyces stackebrandtii]|uniref:transposase n=1 Tax=Streptomyces stackebrandtii TaxID=3051177 RepID=UPI0037DA3BE7